MEQSPSPANGKALIWAAAIVVAVVVVGLVAWRLLGPSPENGPAIAPPMPTNDLAKRAGQPPPEEPETAEPVSSPAKVGQEPVGPEPTTPGPADTPDDEVELTEELFIDISADIVLAGEAYATAPIEGKTLEEVVDSLLEKRSVTKADFERMAAEFVSDDETSERIAAAILMRADEKRISGVETHDRALYEPGGGKADSMSE